MSSSRKCPRNVILEEMSRNRTSRKKGCFQYMGKGESDAWPMCVRSDGSKMYIKLGKEIDSVKVLSVYEGKRRLSWKEISTVGGHEGRCLWLSFAWRKNIEDPFKESEININIRKSFLWLVLWLWSVLLLTPTLRGRCPTSQIGREVTWGQSP